MSEEDVQGHQSLNDSETVEDDVEAHRAALTGNDNEIVDDDVEAHGHDLNDNETVEDA